MLPKSVENVENGVRLDPFQQNSPQRSTGSDNVRYDVLTLLVAGVFLSTLRVFPRALLGGGGRLNASPQVFRG